MNEELQYPLNLRAAVIGYVVRNEGTARTAFINRVLVQLGHDKIKVADLKPIVKAIENDETAWKYYNKALQGKVGLADLPGYRTDKKPLADEEKLNEIAVPSYITNHEKTKMTTRHLKAAQREHSYLSIFMEDLRKEMVQELRSMKDTFKTTLSHNGISISGNEMILTPSDWHIGAVVKDIRTNTYDLVVFRKRLDLYLEHVRSLIAVFDVKRVTVIHLGDLIEHISMRGNQSFNVEHTASQQVGKVTKELIYMLKRLGDMDLAVTFGIIGGNHDRFTGDKSLSQYNDSVAFIIMDNFIMMQKEVPEFLNHVTFLDNLEDVYEIEQTIAGRNCLFRHGDKEKKTTKGGSKIATHIKTHPIDILFTGHFHSTSVTQEDFNRYHIGVGSIMGSNSYAKDHNFPQTSPSQMITVLNESTATPIFIPVAL